MVNGKGLAGMRAFSVYGSTIVVNPCKVFAR